MFFFSFLAWVKIYPQFTVSDCFQICWLHYNLLIIDEIFQTKLTNNKSISNVDVKTVLEKKWFQIQTTKSFNLGDVNLLYTSNKNYYNKYVTSLWVFMLRRCQLKKKCSIQTSFQWLFKIIYFVKKIFTIIKTKQRK